MEEKIRHLEMIQAIINRMSNNSFQLKGWSIVLVSALFALAAKESNKWFVYLAYFPALAFWVLDGFFLRQEKLFRKLYDKVRKMNESEIDFSMDTSSVIKELELWCSVILSKTLCIFHGAILGIIVIMTFMVIYLGN